MRVTKKRTCDKVGRHDLREGPQVVEDTDVVDGSDDVHSAEHRWADYKFSFS